MNRIKSKKIYLLFLLLVTIIITGCVNNGRKQKFVGEGIYAFEKYSYKYPTYEKDCSTAKGVTINSAEYRIINNVSIIKQNNQDVVRDRFIERTKRSVFVSNDSEIDYECIAYSKKGVLGFLQLRQCCFQPLPNINIDAINKGVDEIKKYLDDRKKKLEYIEKQKELNKILEQEPLKPLEPINVPQLPIVISSTTMKLINKINKCLNEGKEYDRDTQECK